MTNADANAHKALPEGSMPESVIPDNVAGLLTVVLERGGIPEAEWMQLANSSGIEPSSVLQEQRLFLVLEGDVVTSAAGRQALTEYRKLLAGEGVGRASSYRRVVVVTDHAVERALQRHPVDRDWDDIRRTIRREVIKGFVHGRVANHKPPWWPLLYGERRGSRQLPKGQLFVWEEGRRRGYVVAREDDGEDVVLTSLHHPGGRAQ